MIQFNIIQWILGLSLFGLNLSSYPFRTYQGLEGFSLRLYQRVVIGYLVVSVVVITLCQVLQPQGTVALIMGITESVLICMGYPFLLINAILSWMQVLRPFKPPTTPEERQVHVVDPDTGDPQVVSEQQIVSPQGSQVLDVSQDLPSGSVTEPMTSPDNPPMRSPSQRPQEEEPLIGSLEDAGSDWYDDWCTPWGSGDTDKPEVSTEVVMVPLRTLQSETTATGGEQPLHRQDTGTYLSQNSSGSMPGPFRSLVRSLVRDIQGVGDHQGNSSDSKSHEIFQVQRQSSMEGTPSIPRASSNRFSRASSSREGATPRNFNSVSFVQRALGQTSTIGGPVRKTELRCRGNPVQPEHQVSSCETKEAIERPESLRDIPPEVPQGVVSV